MLLIYVNFNLTSSIFSSHVCTMKSFLSLLKDELIFLGFFPIIQALITVLLKNFRRLLLLIETFKTLPGLYSPPVCSSHWHSGFVCQLPFSEGLFQRRCNLQKHIPEEPGTQTQSNPSGKYQLL